MSDLVYPNNLPGQLRLRHTTEYRTVIHETRGGKKQVLQLWTTPGYRFRIPYAGLSATIAAPGSWSAYSEIGVVRHFFDTHRGMGDSFLFDLPTEFGGARVRVRFASDELELEPDDDADWYTGEVEFEVVK